MKSALFSVSYAGFRDQATPDIEEFIGHTADLGYDTVKLRGKRPHMSVLDYCPEGIAPAEASKTWTPAPGGF